MYYVFILAIIAIDQTIKFFIRSNLSLGQSIPVIGSILHITYIENSGGAFSILEGQSAVLIIIPAALVAAIIIYIQKNKSGGHVMMLSALSFICGGGAGNLVDRALRSGRVVDFIDFRVFPVFNFADICVCCGCGLLLLYIFITGRNEKTKLMSAEDGK